MKERPILLSGPMVRAVLDGRKTQTRRVVKPEHLKMSGEVHSVLQTLPDRFTADLLTLCPYGQAGERLWVRETFSAHGAFGADGRIAYRADIPDGNEPHGLKWKPSIFMPRRACRLVLEITEIRADRLQNITFRDALAEGIGSSDSPWGLMFSAWRKLWKSINGEASWESNPWVWVIEFKRINQ